MNNLFVTDKDFFGQNGEHQPGKWCVGAVTWCGAIPISPDFETKEQAQQWLDNTINYPDD